MARDWTFLTNHALVLLAIADNPHATLRQIGDTVGITERSAQLLVADLVEEGYLRRFREGRRNRYELVPSKELRHPLNHDRQIRDLLQLLGNTARSDVAG
ncbi:MAG: AsnC family transcriptional regulator [Actinomycetota bacterium]|nr:AsnC family transcriptional regulator [Actinomycetota bacterium]